MIGVGLSVGLSGAPQSGAPASPNPNLLLWSEQFQNALWAKTGGASVTADQGLGDDGTSTADAFIVPVGGVVEQVSTTAAVAGATVTGSFPVNGTLTRRSISGTFDGVIYVFSVFLKDNGAGADVVLKLQRSGGFIAACFTAGQDDEARFLAWGAKLETPGLTDYVKREGT